MPRSVRKISYNGIYHIMLRGVNKQEIFKDDFDRKQFLHSLKYYKEKYNIKIYAYCLMDNHVHILIKDLYKEINKFIQDLAGVYATQYNKKYDRVGHLFQNRYKSENVETKDYLLNVIRYIHKNPDKAGICKMKDYKWSSFKEYIFEEKIISKEDILAIYDKNYKNAIALFEYFSYQEDDEKYLDVNNASRRVDKEILEEINEIVNLQEFKKYTKEQKREAIRKIKQIEGITISQIRRITGISRDVIRQI